MADTDVIRIEITGSATDLRLALKQAERAIKSTSRTAERENAKAGRSFDVAHTKVLNFSSAIGKSNRNFRFFANALKLIKWPAFITAAGLAAQAISALAAATVALTGALAPLTGALVAYPALLGAIGQAAGVVALAGIKDLTQAMAGNEEALKRLSPEGKRFLNTLKEFTPEYRKLQQAAQRPLFAGLERGLRSAMDTFPALRRVIGDTSQTLGHLAAQAGKFVGREGFGRDFEKIGRGNARLLGDMGRAGLHFADALRHVMVEAQPLLRWMGRGIVSFSKFVESEAKAGRESGRMATFFDQTRDVIERLVSIGGSLASVFHEIGQAAAPLGRDILRSLDEGANHLERWAESTSGRRSLRQYFADAKPAIFETGRLLRDMTTEFFRLGSAPGLAPLIRQLRTELLPVLVEMIDTTTRSLGPALVDLLVQLGKLLSNFAGTAGPLQGAIGVLAAMVKTLNFLIEEVPGMKTLVVSFVSLAAVIKAIQFGAALSGIKTLIGAYTSLRTAALGAAAAEGLAGGGGFAGAGAAAAGAFGGAFMAALPPLAILVAGTFVHGGILDTIKGRGATWGDDFGKSFVAAMGRQFDAGLLKDIVKNKLPDWLQITGKASKTSASRLAAFRDGLRGVRDRLAGMPGVTDKTIQSLNDLIHRTEGARRRVQPLGEAFRDLGKPLDKSRKEIKRWADGVLNGIDEAAAAPGFRKLKNAFKDFRQYFSLQAKLIAGNEDDLGKALTKGHTQIAEKTRKALKAFGGKKLDFSVGPWEGVWKHGQRGMRVPGSGDGDKVPAMLEPGEVVINKKAVRQLGGPQRVNRVNQMIPRFAQGGIAPMIGAANRLEAKHFPYRWGGGHSSFALQPEDCSGAVSYVLHAGGLLNTPLVSGALANWGKPGEGAVTVYANAGHTFMSLGGRFFGTSGSNPGGGAGWMPKPSAGYLSGFAKRTAGPGMAGLQQIKRIMMKGPKGPLRDIGQGSLDKARDAANKMLSRSGLGGGDAQNVAGLGHYGKQALMKLWSATGGGGNANLMAAIALAESSGDPRAVSSAGARGLWQIMPFWGGGDKLFEPVFNARKAHKVLSSQGLGAWSVYTNGLYRNFLQKGGMVGQLGAKAKAQYDKLWQRAAPWFGAAGKPAPLVQFGGEHLAEAAGQSYVYAGPRGRRQVFLSPFTIGELQGKGGTRKAGLGTLLHEWAHIFQSPAMLGDTTGREAGAELFRRGAGRGTIKDYKPGPRIKGAGGYGDYEKFQGKYGLRFWQKGQFGENWGADPTKIPWPGGGKKRFAAGGIAWPAQINLGSELRRIEGGGKTGALKKKIATLGLPEYFQRAADRLTGQADQYGDYADRAAGLKELGLAGGRFQGRDQVGWLKAQLTSLWTLRNQLVANLSFIEQMRERVAVLVRRAKRALKTHQKRVRELQKVKKPSKAQKEALKGHKRVVAALKDPIISDLGTQLEGISGAGGSIETIKGALATVQGAGMPSSTVKFKLDPFGVWGGQLFDVQRQLYELGHPETTTDSETSSLLREQLAEERRGRALSQLQYGTLTGFLEELGGLGLPYLGAFAQGITRVKRTGLAVLHQDETVTPDSRGPFGTQLVAGGGSSAPIPQVTIVLRDRAGELVELIDARVDGRQAKVEQRLDKSVGRRMRQRAVSPGR